MAGSFHCWTRFSAEGRVGEGSVHNGEQRPANGGNRCRQRPPAGLAAPSSLLDASASLCPSAAARAALLAQRWGPESRPSPPDATIPTGVISGCARRIRRGPMASIPLAVLPAMARRAVHLGSQRRSGDGPPVGAHAGFAELPPRPGCWGRVVASSPWPLPLGGPVPGRRGRAGAVTVTMRLDHQSPKPHGASSGVAAAWSPWLEAFCPGDRR